MIFVKNVHIKNSTKQNTKTLLDFIYSASTSFLNRHIPIHRHLLEHCLPQHIIEINVQHIITHRKQKLTEIVILLPLEVINIRINNYCKEKNS